MKISMRSVFQILENKNGEYIPLTNEEAKYVSIGGFSFVIDGDVIPFDWDAFSGYEEDGKFYFETGRGWMFNDYEISDCYNEDYEDMDIEKEAITAEFLASATDIEEFFVDFETVEGNEGQAGWFDDNRRNDVQYKINLLEIEFYDVDHNKTYPVAQEVLDKFNGYDTEEYIPSSTNGDYSPSNPWNAPGMSVKDFI